MTRALIPGARPRALVLGARGGIGSAVCDSLRELAVLDTVDIAAVAEVAAPSAEPRAPVVTSPSTSPTMRRATSG